MPSSKTTSSSNSNSNSKSKKPKSKKPSVKQAETVTEPVVTTSKQENTTSDSLPVENAKLSLETHLDILTQTVLTLASTLKGVQKQIVTIQKEYTKEKKLWERKISTKKSNSSKQQPSGFAKPGFISPELCNFLGVSNGTEMARTEVTKYLTEYIKQHELQDTANRRIILPDKKLKGLLQSKTDDTITYFNLQSYMKIHYLNPNKEKKVEATAQVKATAQVEATAQ
jgi:upstream activation factor subunit UAF30